MGIIGKSFTRLEGWLRDFSIEVFASILRPEWIEEALERLGRQTKRERKLTSPLTVWLVIAMGLFRKLSIQNVLARLGKIPGVGSLWEDGEVPRSASAVEARDRVGFGPLRHLQEKFREWVLRTYSEAMSWKGMLLLALDGSTMKVPDSEENRRRFGLPGSSRGGRAAFPQMRVLFLVSTKLHFILGALFAPIRRAEITLAFRMLAQIPQKALLLLDRNFNAWEFFCGLRDQGNHFLIRAKDKMKGKVLARLGRGDRLVEMTVPRALRRRRTDLPKTVVLREITIRVRGETYRFFTSLLEPSTYAAQELVALYLQRWEEELALDEIKTHQCGATTVSRPVIFRCMTTRRVLQEAYGLLLAYNLVRALMVEAAERAHVPPVRISFVDTLERIRDAALLMAAASTPALPRIYRDLIDSISRCILPERRNRFNPREVCTKMASYKKKWKRA